jgi:hypothetical protein
VIEKFEENARTAADLRGRAVVRYGCVGHAELVVLLRAGA